MGNQRSIAVPEAVLRIAIVGHEPAFLEGLKLFFHSIPGCQVVLAAMDGPHLMQQLQNEPPVDVAVVDVHSKTACAYQAIADLREQHPDTVPLAVSCEGDDDSILRAHKAGACGHLLKSYGLPEVERVVLQIRANRRYVSDRVYKCLLDNPEGITLYERTCAQVRAALTERHLELVQLLFTLDELTNHEVAACMGVEHRTVEKHLERIYAAVGVHTKTGLLLICVRSGIVDPHTLPPPTKGAKT